LPCAASVVERTNALVRDDAADAARSCVSQGVVCVKTKEGRSEART
jgi:hypothetical protein